MKSVKCQKCGLVLSATTEICKRCGASLSTGDAELPSDQYERRSQPRVSGSQLGSHDRATTQENLYATLSRLPFLIVVIGVLYLVTGPYLGIIAYPLTLVLFLIGVASSVIALILRKRTGDTTGRLWPHVTGLVINSAFLITFAVVIPAVALSSLVLSAKSPSWREYQSTNGDFTIQMPGEFKVSDDQLNTSNGTLPMHSVHANLKAGGSCTSIYLDYSQYQLTITANDFLEGAIKRFVESSDAVLVSKKPISLDGYEGFEIETKPNSVLGSLVTSSTARIYWAPDKKFVYINHITGPSSGALYTQKSKFLDSFHFLSQQERDAKSAASFGQSPLIEAASKGDITVVNSVLQQGTHDVDKQAAMLFAVYNDRVDVVEALVRSGTSLRSVDNGGTTPLMLAAIRGHRCVPVLIRAGADLNAQDVTNGWTALVWSLKEGQANSAKELIKAGTNLNLRDRNGKTALMHAADLGYKSPYQEVVHQLLTSGADLKLQDNDGQTALAHAERIAQLNPTDKRQAEVVELLKKASGNR